MKTKIILTLCLASLLAAGCAPKTRDIDIINDEGKPVLGLDYRDFDKAASQLVQSMLKSGALAKEDGGRYVMSTGRIVNDTMQRIDTDQLMAKIEEDLLNSGQVVMTSAVGSDKSRDDMIYEVRELRDSETGEEFEKETMAGKGTLVAPDLNVSGKILQRNISYDKKTQQIEYYFQLKITNLTTGLRFWQKETIIGKRGSNKAPAW